MEVLLRGHGGDGGATAVLVRCHGGHGGAAATPLRIGPPRGGTAEVLNMFQVSAVPPRRSAVLTVFGGAMAINDGTTAEPRRSCNWCWSNAYVIDTSKENNTDVQKSILSCPMLQCGSVFSRQFVSAWLIKFTVKNKQGCGHQNQVDE